MTISFFAPLSRKKNILSNINSLNAEPLFTDILSLIIFKSMKYFYTIIIGKLYLSANLNDKSYETS